MWISQSDPIVGFRPSLVAAWSGEFSAEIIAKNSINTTAILLFFKNRVLRLDNAFPNYAVFCESHCFIFLFFLALTDPIAPLLAHDDIFPRLKHLPGFDRIDYLQ